MRNIDPFKNRPCVFDAHTLCLYAERKGGNHMKKYSGRNLDLVAFPIGTINPCLREYE